MKRSTGAISANDVALWTIQLDDVDRIGAIGLFKLGARFLFATENVFGLIIDLGRVLSV